MNRRNFISKSSKTIGFGTIMGANLNHLTDSIKGGEWEAIRNEFLLDRSKIQMSQFLLASHPSKVRNAINHHRKYLDDNPVEYYESNFVKNDYAVLSAASKYLGAQSNEIALTDSTTMGLSLLYTGFDLKPDDDILSTTHDHYSTEKSLEYAAKGTGATLRHLNLYEDPHQTKVDEVLSNLKKNIVPKTRLVAVTLVHSSTGVKLPIKEMSVVIADINKQRTEADKIYFCVDAVHGFGVENITIEDLGCDFLVAGTHKWLFGPRGTGIIWAKKDAWHMVNSTIPPFSAAYLMWMDKMPKGPLSFYSKITPGGFHSFEHRWALKEAFEFHIEIGKNKIQDRTHHLSLLLKEGLEKISHIKLHTPLSPSLSSGINCFEVDGIEAEDVVKKLVMKNIIASTTPYKKVYARLTPCIINTEEEVVKCIEALENIMS
tara:strand:- start:3085 stop:4377 length:1293 start_codon:yes stop_codon:yes gene_type:complete